MSEPERPLDAWTAWFRSDPRRVDVAVATVTTTVAFVVLLGGPVDHDVGLSDALATLATFVLVLLRRRWPLPLLAVSVVASFGYAVIWGRTSTLVGAVLVLLGTVCVRLERRPAIALGVAVALLLSIHSAIVNDGFAPGEFRLVFGPVSAAAAVGIADAVRSWRSYRDAAEAQVRAAVLASEAQTRRHVAEERLAIARELHDLIGHSLSIMNVQTGVASHLLRTDPDRAEAALAATRDAGRTVLDELRDLLSVLRHDGAPEGAPRSSLPSFADVPRLIDTIRAAGLDVTTTESGRPRDLAPAVSVAAYRIVQEALTNAAKYGGGSAALATEWDDDWMGLTVTNPSPVATPSGGDRPGGQGLVGMRERAVVNGGMLDVERVGSEFRVRARLPVVRSTEGGVA